MIDMPAEPPPEEGSGDDFLESGLPRAVFDAEIALEVEAPSEAKLAALEVSAGHTIAPETREAVKEAFVRQSDAAASAIGTYRLHAIDEDEALRQIGRAREKYETEAARTLGVSRDAFLRAFTSAE